MKKSTKQLLILFGVALVAAHFFMQYRNAG
jgi:hypothetical protein